MITFILTTLWITVSWCVLLYHLSTQRIISKVRRNRKAKNRWMWILVRWHCKLLKRQNKKKKNEVYSNYGHDHNILHYIKFITIYGGGVIFATSFILSMHNTPPNDSTYYFALMIAIWHITKFVFKDQLLNVQGFTIWCEGNLKQ